MLVIKKNRIESSIVRALDEALEFGSAPEVACENGA